MTRNSNRELREAIGRKAGSFYVNTARARLVYYSLRRGETQLSASGAVLAQTGAYTGRSPKDRFLVIDDATRGTVWWENAGGIEPEQFERLAEDMRAATAGQEMFCQQLFAGADPGSRLGVEVLSSSAWHSLFIRNLLIRPDTEGLAGFEPDVTVLHLPGFLADPVRHGVRSQTAIALDLSRNLILVCGTGYAGEIKKAVFSLFNFHAPGQGILPMHCAANQGADGETALLFGLSGTGKTTLSADPDRVLIGDDEHGWTKTGIFNLEGGCYAKVINLSATAEPAIANACGQFGTVLENVVADPETGLPDFTDGSLTENTRAAFPIEALGKVSSTGTGPAPKTVILLTADAFGVMPPAARLTTEQAIYHFLSGYTAKIPGTERGVTEPVATFSACFGAPFMSLHPTVYGGMLKQRLEASGAECWLINTGWTGGAFGVGKRISISTTRRLLGLAMSGALGRAPMRVDPHFGFEVPVEAESIRPDILDPRSRWASGDDYDAQARMLAAKFVANFTRLGAPAKPLAAAGPQLSDAA